MNGFQTTILGVAVVMLILILTVVGLIMANNKANLLFPPTSLPCPNYWQLNAADGTCMIPQPINDPGSGTIIPAINVGTWSTTAKFRDKLAPGITSDSAYINFADASWGSGNTSATCAKKKWANNFGIMWDGVSNFNGCT